MALGKHKWDMYTTSIRHKRIERSIFNIGRYWMLWGRAKDGRRYLEKVLSVYNDPMHLENSKNSFMECLNTFIPIDLEISKTGLQKIYYEYSGSDIKSRNKRLEVLHRIYFEQASKLIEEFRSEHNLTKSQAF